MCVTHDHIYFPFVVPKHLSSPGFFLPLVGLVLFMLCMLCMLSTYMTSSGTMSAQKRRSNSLHSEFFWRGFIFVIDVICIVIRILVSNTIYIVCLLLSPCLCWCWFVSLQIWHSCLQRGLSTFIHKQNNYRWSWCMQINCRSICSRLLNIPTDSPSTLLIVLYKY
jgi:hypothetical protein